MTGPREHLCNHTVVARCPKWGLGAIIVPRKERSSPNSRWSRPEAGGISATRRMQLGFGVSHK